ncbi:MAG: glycosyltransferase, partial [Roseimicrobium sp.]
MPLFSATSVPGHVGNLRAEGPWLRDANGLKVRLRGVTYGPFRLNEEGLPWPTPAQLASDLAHIRTLGFNAVRVYEAPTEAVLQECARNGLHLFCWLRWGQNVDFFENADLCQQARQLVREEAHRLAQHPAVAALLVGNEIEKNLVRWLGPVRVLDFVEELVALAKEAAPGKLVSYASYPSTEYLIPRQADFVAFNVFLEERHAFARYLQRLQNLAGDRPLVLTEFGLDTRSRGEAAQAETLLWHREVLEELGAAGSFWFSYTDEWQNGGVAVEDWAFGLVTKQRAEKQVCRHLRAPALQPSPTAPERPVAASLPSVSVIVCTRNGAATLQQCLESLACQTLPPLEVLVVDDGSTDPTPAIAQAYAFVRYHRQEHAGLGVARNVGMSLARGDVLAYTDDDCMADEDWLRQVVRAFQDPRCVAAGGPNVPPPPRNATEACVALAPGAPSHVLLDDFEAEHLPGCNLVIRRSALEEVGGFGAEFLAAGDDVDVCW